MNTPQFFLDRVKRFCDDNNTSEASLLRKADVSGATLSILRIRLKTNEDAGMNTNTQSKIVQAMEAIKDDQERTA